MTRQENRVRRAEAVAAEHTFYWGIGCRNCDRYSVERYTSTGERHSSEGTGEK